MGFFERMYYGKAGKRDYSEQDMPKNRVSLFFRVLKDHIFDLVKVNLLQLIFWIPFLFWTYINFAAVQAIDVQAILDAGGGYAELSAQINGYLFMWLLGLIPCVAITGPSSAGAAYIMRNWARDQHAFLFSDFKDAFKLNWKQALVVSVVTAFVPALAYTAITYYGALAAQNLVMFLPMVVVACIAILWTIMLPLIYPMMIGYELRLRDLLKNALLMGCARLPHMVLARLITVLPIVLVFVAVYIGNALMLMLISLYYILFGFALSRLVYASIANGIFDRYLNPHIEGAQVRMGLRPQDEDDLPLDDDDEDEDEEDEEEDD